MVFQGARAAAGRRGWGRSFHRGGHVPLRGRTAALAAQAAAALHPSGAPRGGSKPRARGGPRLSPELRPRLQAIEKDPSDHVFYSNRSACYLSKGDKAAALSDAEKCVGAKPDWAKGYSRKGSALQALGRVGEAVEAYEEGTAGAREPHCGGVSSLRTPWQGSSWTPRTRL